MEEQIDKILDQYYDSAVPVIKQLAVLYSSPKEGIITLRWRDEQDQTITVKSIFQADQILLTPLV